MKTTTFLLLTLLIVSGCATRSDGGARVRPLSNDPAALSGGIPLDDGNTVANNGSVQFPDYAFGGQPNEFLGETPYNAGTTNQQPTQTAYNNHAAPLIPGQNSQTSTTDGTYQPSQNQSSGVQSLLDEANAAVKANQLERAATALNRAVKIEPNNASIWYDLAQIRLHQGKYEQSEQLAKKSIDFAKSNQDLVNKNWRVISSARKARGDTVGADEATRNAQ